MNAPQTKATEPSDDEGPYTEITIAAYNVRKLPEAAAERVKDRIADALREAIWDDQEPYDRHDEDKGYADFDIHSTVLVSS